MIIETYQIVCPSCLGKGILQTTFNPAYIATPVITCKACMGSGVVTVTRTITEPESTCHHPGFNLLDHTKDDQGMGGL